MYKRYWLVSFWKNGFEGKMLVYGTEEELQDYFNSEIGGGDSRYTGDYCYHGATEQEVKAARLLKMKAYIAPEIRRETKC